MAPRKIRSVTAKLPRLQTQRRRASAISIASMSDPPTTDRTTNLDQRMGTLETAIARLIDFKVQFASTSKKSEPVQAAVRVGINGDGVPIFDPSDANGLKVDEWLVTLGQIRDMHRWGDSATIHFGTAKLMGPAKVWWTHLKEKRLSWEEFQMKMMEAFPIKENCAELVKRMMRRKKEDDETYVAYYYDKLGMIERLYFKGSDAVDLLADGINEPIIREQANSGMYPTPESLLVYLSGRNNAPNKHGEKVNPNHVTTVSPNVRYVIDEVDVSGQRYESIGAADQTMEVGDTDLDDESGYDESDIEVDQSATD